jgi:hypothetical protein
LAGAVAGMGGGALTGLGSGRAIDGRGLNAPVIRNSTRSTKKNSVARNSSNRRFFFRPIFFYFHLFL